MAAALWPNGWSMFLALLVCAIVVPQDAAETGVLANETVSGTDSGAEAPASGTDSSADVPATGTDSDTGVPATETDSDTGGTDSGTGASADGTESGSQDGASSASAGQNTSGSRGGNEKQASDDGSVVTDAVYRIIIGLKDDWLRYFYNAAHVIVISGFFTAYPYEAAMSEDIYGKLWSYGPGWVIGNIFHTFWTLSLLFIFMAGVYMCFTRRYRIQNEKPDTREIQFVSALVIHFAVMAFLAAYMAIYICSQLPIVVDQGLNNTDNARHDIILFADSLVGRSIAKNLEAGRKFFHNSLDNTGPSIGKAIRQSLENDLCLENLTRLEEMTSRASTRALTLETSYDHFKRTRLLLNNAMQDNNVTEPPLNMNDTVDLEPTTTPLQALAAKSLGPPKHPDLEKEFSEISKLTSAAAVPAVQTLKTQIDEFVGNLGVIKDLLAGVRTGLHKTPDELKRFKYALNLAGRFSAIHIPAFVYTVGPLVMLITLVMLLSVVAILKKVDYGSSFLHIALLVFLSFGWLVMIVTTILYVAGSTGAKIMCQPILQPSFTILDNIIEKHWYAGDGTWPGREVLGQTNSTVTVGKVLRSCKDNKAVYVAFDMDKSDQANLTQLLASKDEIGIDENVGKVTPDIQPFSTISDETDRHLFELKTIGRAVPYKEMDRKVNEAENISYALIHHEKTAVRRNADSLQKASIRVRRYMIELRKIFVEIAELCATSNISMSIPPARDKAVRNVSTVLRQIVDGLVNEITYELQVNFGKCRPLYNVFLGLLITDLCKNTVYMINGLWLALGSMCMFMVLAVSFAYLLVWDEPARKEKKERLVARQTVEIAYASPEVSVDKTKEPALSRKALVSYFFSAKKRIVSSWFMPYKEPADRFLDMYQDRPLSGSSTSIDGEVESDVDGEPESEVDLRTVSESESSESKESTSVDVRAFEETEGYLPERKPAPKAGIINTTPESPFIDLPMERLEDVEEAPPPAGRPAQKRAYPAPKAGIIDTGPESPFTELPMTRLEQVKEPVPKKKKWWKKDILRRRKTRDLRSGKMSWWKKLVSRPKKAGGLAAQPECLFTGEPVTRLESTSAEEAEPEPERVTDRKPSEEIPEPPSDTYSYRKRITSKALSKVTEPRKPPTGISEDALTDLSTERARGSVAIEGLSPTDRPTETVARSWLEDPFAEQPIAFSRGSAATSDRESLKPRAQGPMWPWSRGARPRQSSMEPVQDPFAGEPRFGWPWFSRKESAQPPTREPPVPLTAVPEPSWREVSVAEPSMREQSRRKLTFAAEEATEYLLPVPAEYTEASAAQQPGEASMRRLSARRSTAGSRRVTFIGKPIITARRSTDISEASEAGIGELSSGRRTTLATEASREPDEQEASEEEEHSEGKEDDLTGDAIEQPSA